MDAYEPAVALVSVDGLLHGASNATMLARDSDGRAWVYKPVRGVRPLWDFEPRSLPRREIACYRLSEALGLRVVPETVPATGPYGSGSAQAYLDEDFTWDPRPEIVSADPRLWPVVVLDVIANNADRKIGHLLKEPGADRVWAIDNGLSFHTDAKLRTVLWSFAGQAIPDEIVERLDPELAMTALAGMLDDAEVEAR